MKPTERDELLVRIDERSRNIWRVVEQLETHQAEQNGYIKENLESTIKNTSWRKTDKWLLGILFTLILGAFGVIFGM